MDQLFAQKAYIIAAALVVLFVAERLYPAARQRWNSARLGRNFALAFINFMLGPLIVLPLSAYAAMHGLGLRPGWWNIGFDLVVLDGWIYAWHRLNHKLPFLWRFHEVHHLDEALDTTTGVRFHFGEVVMSAVVRAIVIWALAIPLFTVAIFETLVVLAALFQHSNLKLPSIFENLLSKFIVTPKLHWVHHHALREDTDSNYATMLSFWDILFRSRSPHARRTDMIIGVEGKPEKGLIAILLMPFSRRD